MAITILDPTVAAAVAAATNQESQRAALIAPWTGGLDVTVRSVAGATLRDVTTYGTWALDSNTPRGMTLGALMARTVSSTGAPTSFVFRAGSTDILSMTAAVSPANADIVLAGPIDATARTNLADAIAGKMTITANPALPLTASVPLTIGAQFTSLAVYNESGSGPRPFSATILPLRGQVPAGSTVGSSTDSTLRGTILSTHDDGSAAIIIVSGTASGTGSIDINVATGDAGNNLTAAAITALVTSVSVNFQGTYGVGTISNFSAPERIWWASPTTICARYRVAAPNPGGTALEAVVDVQAWSGRALVEVVVENAKLTIGALGVATPKPDAATYTAATVSINGGAAIATVNSADVPTEAAHSAFRGWYAAGWVGAGATGLRVTQLHSELQLHPLLFKCDQASTFDMAGYASDAYTPWSTGRYRPAGMGGGGDHEQIGPLPKWEARALQSGDYRAWQATEASALAFLGYACQYRDAATGDVPTFTKLKVNNVSQSGYSVGNPSAWPNQAGTTGPMSLEVAHHPAVGLMAFAARPSPVFIELAQKLAVWNGTYSVVSGGGPVTTTGVFGRFYQVRGRAWAMRSLAHATFLTPDSHPWKAPAKVSISDNVTYLDGWRTSSMALLNAVWDETPTVVSDGYVIGPPTAGGANAYGSAMWMQHYLITETAKAANANLLTGSAQTALETLADWLALQPVRWVNEQPSGAWRYIPYATPIGRNSVTMDSLSTYALQMDYWYDDAPPSVSGTWFCYTGTTGKTYAGFTAQTTTPQDFYPMYFWSALQAAHERGVAGADTALSTVLSGITNLTTWRAGFGADPRWGSLSRSYSAAPSWRASATEKVWYELPVSQTFAAWLQATDATNYGGSDPYGGVVSAYCSGAYSPTLRKSVYHGGGHGDSRNNGGYYFDWQNAAYGVVWNSTPLASRPPDYATTGGYALYPSGLHTGRFETSAVLTDPADTSYAAAALSVPSRHTYSGCEIVNIGGAWHYIRLYAAPGEWNLTTGVMRDVSQIAWGQRLLDCTGYYRDGVLRADQTSAARGYANYFNLTGAASYTQGMVAINGGAQQIGQLARSTQSVRDPATGKFWATLNPGDWSMNGRNGVMRYSADGQTVEVVVDSAAGYANWAIELSTSLCVAGSYLYVFTVNTPGVGTNTAMRAWRIHTTTLAMEWITIVGDSLTWTAGGQEAVPCFFDGLEIIRWNYVESRDAVYRLSLTPESGAGTVGSPYVMRHTRQVLTTSAMPLPSYTYRLDYDRDLQGVCFLPRGNAKPWFLPWAWRG